MEGPLSKWTNVMHGWQYRWFVLDQRTGLLSYYVSKEKMMRGSRRGCVRLKNAVIGIDDEDESTFTITVDQKTFHFQARNAEEREQWVMKLEETIMGFHTKTSKKTQNGGTALETAPSLEEFDRGLTETDAYLQLISDQAQKLQHQINTCDSEETREKCKSIKVTTDGMIESIKHTVLMLQLARQSLVSGGSAQSGDVPPAVDILAHQRHVTRQTRQKLARVNEQLQQMSLQDVVIPRVPTAQWYLSKPEETGDVQSGAELATAEGGSEVSSVSMGGSTGTSPRVSHRSSPAGGSPVSTPELMRVSALDFPSASYSSSDSESYYDASEQTSSPNGRSSFLNSSLNNANNTNPTEVKHSKPANRTSDKAHNPVHIHCDGNALYEEDETDLGSLESQGSIIRHLLSQVRIGMDLTKVVLPTFILERRSTLEMYADFFAHPDIFVSIAHQKDARARLLQTVRWYMTAFHAGRKSAVAKKPYNPILGEIFRCTWEVPGIAENPTIVKDGPLPWARSSQLSYIAEQVSHHPPISAFYAECPNERISFDGYIWTKSKFLGLSIGVHMVGKAVLSLLDYDEEYILTFPSGYGRQILTVPWFEMGGKCEVSCAKTGYRADITFHTKPFYGGKKHRISANLYDPKEKKPFCTVEGEWNGVMYLKHANGQSELLADTTRLPIIKKVCRPFSDQEKYESRKLWQDVTRNLKLRRVEEATEGKRLLEQKQREEAKRREKLKEKWKTKYFHEVGEHWVFDRPLQTRPAASTSLQLGSVKPGPVQQGSVQPGPVQQGSVTLGSSARSTKQPSVSQEQAERQALQARSTTGSKRQSKSQSKPDPHSSVEVMYTAPCSPTLSLSHTKPH